MLSPTLPAAGLCPHLTWYRGVSQDEVSGALVLEAVGDISQGDELSLSYLDAPVLPPRRERQRRLQATYHFTCACALCTIGEKEDDCGVAEDGAEPLASSTISVTGERTKAPTTGTSEQPAESTTDTSIQAKMQQEEEEAYVALEGLACPQCMTGLLRPRGISGPLNSQDKIASPIGQGDDGKGGGSRGWACKGCGAWASEGWAGAAADKIDALHHKVRSPYTDSLS